MTVECPTQKVTYVIRGLSSPPQDPDPTKRARATFPKINATTTCAHTMGQDYPLTDPSPGANPTIYPSSLPLALGKMPGDIFPKAMDFFSFFLVLYNSSKFMSF
jgi:hypothetical protein